MSEIVTTYLLRDLTEPLPMERDEFYEEQIAVFKKTGKPTRSVEVVQTFLFTPDREFILQKRSRRKNHNPGLLDKTLGGHIRFGDTPDGWMYETQARKKQSGFWPLLNFWMAIVLNRMGEKKRAPRYYDKVVASINQYIPEQIFSNATQQSVSPLCWSHAMFIIASKELGYPL